jgi:cellulose synthase/poly-beta-1,6-N-acetylglucosamine synthase-like glycosyltransferase
MPISIGIPAYNEEKNIGALLDALLSAQSNLKGHPQPQRSQVIIIASGCTDKTVEIVRARQKKHPQILLITENERSGKAAAVNLFIKHAKNNICVLISADTLPLPGTIQKLCAPLQDPKIGLVGGHPVPVNPPDNFIGFCVKTLWELHHEIALKAPKCGEIIAFRKVFDSIPANSPVDEASIEAKIAQHGLKTVYAPDAIVQNKGPTTIRDYIRQRRRVNAGHFWLKKNAGHIVATTNYISIFKLTIKKFSWNIKKNIWLIGLVKLEILSKMLAFFDFYLLKKDYSIWRQIKTSK